MGGFRSICCISSAVFASGVLTSSYYIVVFGLVLGNVLVLNCASIHANQTAGDFVQNSGSLTLVALTFDEACSFVFDILLCSVSVVATLHTSLPIFAVHWWGINLWIEGDWCILHWDRSVSHISTLSYIDLSLLVFDVPKWTRIFMCDQWDSSRNTGNHLPVKFYFPCVGIIPSCYSLRYISVLISLEDLPLILTAVNADVAHRYVYERITRWVSYHWQNV